MIIYLYNKNEEGDQNEMIYKEKIDKLNQQITIKNNKIEQLLNEL